METVVLWIFVRPAVLITVQGYKLVIDSSSPVALRTGCVLDFRSFTEFIEGQDGLEQGESQVGQE